MGLGVVDGGGEEKNVLCSTILYESFVTQHARATRVIAKQGRGEGCSRAYSEWRCGTLLEFHRISRCTPCPHLIASHRAWCARAVRWAGPAVCSLVCTFRVVQCPSEVHVCATVVWVMCSAMILSNVLSTRPKLLHCTVRRFYRNVSGVRTVIPCASIASASNRRLVLTKLWDRTVLVQ